MKMNGIKNIIFDLGGVIIPIDIQRTYQAFMKIAERNLFSLPDFKQIDIFHDLEIGNINEVQFRDKLRLLIGDVSDEEIDTAWLDLLLHLPEERLRLIKELKNDYRIILLSNTNDIHLRAIRLQNTFMVPELHFKNLFEQEYYSHEINLRKPSKEIYQYVLDKSGLKASETIFIDDIYENAMAAELVGIRGMHLDLTKQDLTAFFESMKVD